MTRPYLPGISSGRTRGLRRQSSLRSRARRPVLEGMEARIAPAVRTWTGLGLTANWTDSDNWDAAVNPGDDLVFPASAGDFLPNNDFPANTKFASIEIDGQGYQIQGNAVELTGSTADPSLALVATYGSGTSLDLLPTQFDAGVSVASGGELELEGVLSGSGGLTLSGGGLLVVSADNGAGLGATVKAGTLQVDGALGDVTVNPGATLAGSGTVGAVTSTGGTVQAGTFSTPGVLTINGDLTLNSSSTVATLINSDTAGTGFGSLAVDGAINLNGANLALTFGPSYTPAQGDVLTLIQNYGTGAVNGTFFGLFEGTTLFAGPSETYNFTYVGGDGNDVAMDYLESTTTTLDVSANPSVFGQPVTLTATVTPAAGTVAGTVQFMDGPNLLGTAPLNGSGQATLTLSNPGVGHHSFFAAYQGDSSDAPSSSSTTRATVNQADTTTTVTAAPGPSVYGQSVTLTASVAPVAPGAGTPTGTVDFYDGATVLGHGTLNGSGQATLTLKLQGGTHSIQAVYGGDGQFVTSTSSAQSETVNPAAVSGAFFQLSINPAAYGQVLVFRMVAFPTAGGVDPTGTVTFSEGATVLATGTLDTSSPAGSQVYYFYQLPNNPALAVGTHTLTAAYGGDANYLGVTPPSQSQTITPAGTSTFVSSSDDPAVYGEPLTFTASVSPDFAGVPTGTVTFMDGSTVLGTGTLDGTGTATFTTSNLAPGDHTITAVYGGDPNFTGSTSPGSDQTIDPADTKSVVASSANPSVWGQAVTLTATVSAAAPGAGTPTGTVNFFDGATLLGTTTLNGSGVATFTTAALAVGSHSFTASYGGDPDFNTSTSAADTSTVNPADTTTALAAAPNPSVYGRSVMLMATVATVAPGAGTATGLVQLLDNGSPIATTTLDASGAATFHVSSLAVGGHVLSVSYAGDGSFGPAVSLPFSQAVNPAVVSATLTPAVLAPAYGQPETFVVNVAAVAPGAGVPTGTVTFYDGTTALGTAPVNGGVATFTTSALAVGGHPITATYGGDAHFLAAATRTVGVTVARALTHTTLAAPLSATVYGQWLALTATVTAAAPGAAVPAGTVTFYDGTTALGTVTPVGGVATFVATSLAPGAHAITAVYGGDGHTTGSTSSTFALNVARDNTTLTVNGPAGQAAAVFGQPYVVTATVAAAGPGAGAPLGVVLFYDNGVVAGGAWVVNGRAQCGLLLSPAASWHTITASYQGNAQFKPALSPLVTAVTAAPTLTTLLPAPVQGPSGTPVGAFLVASVAPTTPYAGAATGTVTFYVNGLPLGTRTLVNGSAFVYVGPAGANQSYTVRYGGAANLLPSNSPVVRLGSSFTAMSARSLRSLSARGTLQAKRG